MTNPSLTLEGVSCFLPDGRPLFSDLNALFDARHTGLVGRNGAGKSVLARVMAGRLAPSAGRCLRTGEVFYLAQQVQVDGAHTTVAALAGVQGALDALARIEAGDGTPEDFDTIGERWDLRPRLQAELERCGLGHLDLHAPAQALSGGEAMRVALAGAALSHADWLILDEPSNHLDRPNRDALIRQLQRWPKGLVVVSHDRRLLDTMARIVELSPAGLRSYGGGYALYAERRAEEEAAALALLERRKVERRREARALSEQRERAERREAQGRRHGREANQAKILLDRQKARSESTAGRLRRQHAAAREQLDLNVREAAMEVTDAARIVMCPAPAVGMAWRWIAALDDVVLPHAPPGTRAIRLALHGQQRVGVTGANGSGKSTLLKVLAGQIAPLAGRCSVRVASAWLDQRLASLAPQRTVIEQMREANRTAGEDALRTRLAQLGLDAHKLAAPCGALSGGERLKAALACAIYADPPAQLLLLDEPGNHLDLPSLQALEAMLRDYRGALMVVSHDEAFLESLDLTDRLEATLEGWKMTPL
ncbi:ABC-F family ATP-binding cassette domain-containing protein [Paraburkholderia silviterrae]|uniref:ABC-F family ATP-binding cassette domain-containing protein n=1 Tax=Paraburkholderia silviterrae TaxID=2528715 RepID=A0A4R5M2L8_9BURK|nr:ATP-binding cassette domain-containing protein [Paraburkholderia silviterrae]TDG19807.1 ABC-F family ATP-binding cassette domain-containing protein [Paraburkholderia silviterrae]